MIPRFAIRDWFSNPSRELLSGLVVAFAMIPEAIAFSGIAGVDPEVGLFGAFCLAITISFVGGRKAMITSATGSTALLMTNLVMLGNQRGEGQGLQYLIAAGLLTGLLQIVWGYLRLAHQMRFVPQSVLSGFVNALALLIFQAQLPQLGINLRFGEEVHGVVAHLPQGASQLGAVWGLTALGLLIIYGLPRLTRIVPSALVAIAVTTAITMGFKLDIPTVSSLGQLPTGLPSLGLPFGSAASGHVPFDLDTLGFVLPTALAISLVGLMETFLTQDLLDDMTDSSSDKNREARGQGIANIVSSLFGGMAGCALVGQSVMNIQNGGRTRLSTFAAGLSLLLMILLARPWVSQIPMASLVAVMIAIAISTADFTSLRRIRVIPKSDSAVMLTTFAVTMLTTPHNLALGVLAGVALAAILFSRKVAKVITVTADRRNDCLTYTVRGMLFFVSANYFLQGFDTHDHARDIVIDMTGTRIWDQTGVASLQKITARLAKGGSDVQVIGLDTSSADLFDRLTEGNSVAASGAH